MMIALTFIPFNWVFLVRKGNSLLYDRTLHCNSYILQFRFECFFLNLQPKTRKNNLLGLDARIKTAERETRSIAIVERERSDQEGPFQDGSADELPCPTLRSRVSSSGDSLSSGSCRPHPSSQSARVLETTILWRNPCLVVCWWTSWKNLYSDLSSVVDSGKLRDLVCEEYFEVGSLMQSTEGTTPSARSLNWNSFNELKA